ncbi:MAG TPA: hypothetical protein DDW50_13045 [Firmicutes bacterium]|jgi:hypothetical protein|nr:hypothetical protein [Bacillota bacterium]
MPKPLMICPGADKGRRELVRKPILPKPLGPKDIHLKIANFLNKSIGFCNGNRNNKCKYFTFCLEEGRA